MCGISAIFGSSVRAADLNRMVDAQRHRGPDAQGTHFEPSRCAGLGHNRLSIIDLSDAGRQPMSDPSGRYWIVFNGEIYNYLELRRELVEQFQFRTQTDTEVLLAAFITWGPACLDRFLGMFAFLIWDEQEQSVFGARDRFGVKPLHYYEPAPGELWVASEIKALHSAGVPRVPNPTTWATYLVHGMYDNGRDTFWSGIRRLPPGHCFTWSLTHGMHEWAWYDLTKRLANSGQDHRPEGAVTDELLALLEESIRLRFRADVPVGICLSGGLDSSLLLGLVHRVQGADSTVKTFTFHCGDARYDELPWVEQMLAETRHPACFCRLTAEEASGLAEEIQRFQDEPFGGIPTLGMAKVHQRAREEGVVVLLDGNGLDEAWAGYEYYQRATAIDPTTGPVQGSRDPSTRPECLNPDLATLAQGAPFAAQSADSVANLQLRDITLAKIPRAMRFADRVSMQFSRELREPFLDHRIVELGLRQPVDRRIRNGQGKWLVRQLATRILPKGVREAPKRPVQTPQREWLRGPLQPWAQNRIDAALAAHPDWLTPHPVLTALDAFAAGSGDNSFPIWQWVSAGMLS